MDEPKHSLLATALVAILEAIAYLGFGLIGLILVAAFHPPSWPRENPILAAVIGTSVAAIAILALIRRINRRHDARQKCPPLDPH